MPELGWAIIGREMSLEAIIVISVAGLLAALVLTGALMVWRVLGRSGRAVRAAGERLDERALTIPVRAASIRERLVSVRGESERALWSLSNLDSRLAATQASLADKRAASDRLRASMAHNVPELVRLRNGVRLLLRAIQMRREFLG